MGKINEISKESTQSFGGNSFTTKIEENTVVFDSAKDAFKFNDPIDVPSLTVNGQPLSAGGSSNMQVVVTTDEIPYIEPNKFYVVARNVERINLRRTGEIPGVMNVWRGTFQTGSAQGRIRFEGEIAPYWSTSGEIPNSLSSSSVYVFEVQGNQQVGYCARLEKFVNVPFVQLSKTLLDGEQICSFDLEKFEGSTKTVRVTNTTSSFSTGQVYEIINGLEGDVEVIDNGDGTITFNYINDCQGNIEIRAKQDDDTAVAEINAYTANKVTYVNGVRYAKFYIDETYENSKTIGITNNSGTYTTGQLYDIENTVSDCVEAEDNLNGTLTASFKQMGGSTLFVKATGDDEAAQIDIVCTSTTLIDNDKHHVVTLDGINELAYSGQISDSIQGNLYSNLASVSSSDESVATVEDVGNGTIRVNYVSEGVAVIYVTGYEDTAEATLFVNCL